MADQVSQRDIARICGVSQGTVSAALNGPGSPVRIGEETRRRVVEVASRLGYRPHAAARQLRNGRSRTIIFTPTSSAGVLTYHVTNTEVVAISRTVASRGYALELAVYEETVRNANPLDAAVRERRCDGVILSDSAVTERHFWPVLQEFGTPVCVLDSEPLPGVTTIKYDYRGGARAATNHLLDLGRTRIAFAEPAQFGGYWSAERLAGYLEAHEHAGLQADPRLRVRVPHVLLPDGRAARDGERIFRDFFTCGLEFDAVFCVYDWQAVMAMRALATLGRRVPDDVAVVGFDDEPISQALVPSLTSVRMGAARAGQLAAELLIEQIEGRRDGGDHHVLPCELAVRESTMGRSRQERDEPAHASALVVH